MCGGISQIHNFYIFVLICDSVVFFMSGVRIFEDVAASKVLTISVLAHSHIFLYLISFSRTSYLLV